MPGLSEGLGAYEPGYKKRFLEGTATAGGWPLTPPPGLLAPPADAAAGVSMSLSPGTTAQAGSGVDPGFLSMLIRLLTQGGGVAPGPTSPRRFSPSADVSTMGR